MSRAIEKKIQKYRENMVRLSFLFHSPSPNPVRYFHFPFIPIAHTMATERKKTQNSYFNSVFACSCKLVFTKHRLRTWNNETNKAQQLYNIHAAAAAAALLCSFWRVVFFTCTRCALCALVQLKIQNHILRALGSSNRFKFDVRYICETNSNERKGKERNESVYVYGIREVYNLIFSFIFWFQAWTCNAA